MSCSRELLGAIHAEANRRGWALENYADEGTIGKYINRNLRGALQLLASDAEADRVA